MKAISEWMLVFLLLFSGVAWAGAGHPASGEDASVSSAVPSAALTGEPAVASDAAPAEEPGFVQTIQIKALALLLAVLKGITWGVLALIGLYFCLIFLVFFVHITAWFLAQIMGRIVAVALAAFLIVGCLSLL